MNVYKKIGLLWLAICLLRLSARSQTAQADSHPYWQQRVDYHIDVRLDDANHALDGSASLQYANHSPDTLSYLWIRCSPNAFKNDRTAFSEQRLENGRTDFYFSTPQQRGYINRLDFHVNGQEVKMEDHPQYIDIIKVILPKPLPPGGEITLSTPFHIQLPYNFSDNGWSADGYEVTQWYPKPARYDSRGWHPLPYLGQGQGEGNDEYGSFDVSITVPNSFTVAATGDLQNASGRQELAPSNAWDIPASPPHKASGFFNHGQQPAKKRQPPSIALPRDTSTKTLHYYQQDIHDFTWFADRHFHTLHDTLELPSGRIIDVYAFYTPSAGPGWNQSISHIKTAILSHSSRIGEYPHNSFTIVAPSTTQGTTGTVENSIQHQVRAVFANSSNLPPDTLFALENARRPLPPLPADRRLKTAFLFNLHHTDSIQYLSLAPALGYNEYDHLMIGVLIHNFNLPPSPFQFFLAPLYATGSHQLNGLSQAIYTILPDHGCQKIQFGLGLARFSTVNGTDSSGHQLTGGYYKVTPSILIVFPNGSAHRSFQTALEAKTYLIGEKTLDNFVLKTADSSYYPTPGKYSFRYLNQLSFQIKDSRVLYPYKAILQIQQAPNFYRINVTGNYFFNYEKGGGLDIRLFGAKFGYLGGQSASEDLSQFEPKLTAVRGNEDYTYDNFFLGRSAFTGFASQQIMDRDGDLHLRTDLFQGLQGRSDDWVTSLNARTTLPRAIVPEWIPLRIFFDVGTYAEAWQTNPPTSHFLYTGGFELDLFHDVLRIYAPLVYSSDFSSQLRTVPDQNSFWQKISFSVDLQNIDFRKLFGNTPI
jgi:hypothetical protein